MMTDPQHSAPAGTDLPRDEKLEIAIEEICRFATKLKNAKVNEDEIRKRLTDAGLSAEAARTVMQSGAARLGKDQRASSKKLWMGALWFGGGGFFAFALGSTGWSWLGYVAMLVGLFQMLASLLELRRAARGHAEVRQIIERIRATIQAEETSRWKIAAIKIHNP